MRSEAARTEFARLHPERALGKLLDVTDHAAVATTITHIESKTGPIDVLVNNAGYGH